MASVIVTVMTIAMLLAGVSLVAQSSFKSLDELSDTWQQAEQRAGDIARTSMEAIDTSHGGASVELIVGNSGQTALRDFEKWDVVLMYYEQSGDYHQLWLPYQSSYPPDFNTWTVEGIYIDAVSKPEVHQPGIFDPGEEMVIELKLSPSAKADGSNRIVVAAPNGVVVSSPF